MRFGTIATLQRQAGLRNNHASRSTQDLVGFGAPLLAFHTVTESSRAHCKGELDGSGRISKFLFVNLHLTSAMDGCDRPIVEWRNEFRMIRPPYLSVDLHFLSNAFDHPVTSHSVTKRSRTHCKGTFAEKTSLEVFVLPYSSLVCHGRLRFSDRAVKERSLLVGSEQGRYSVRRSNGFTRQRIPRAPSRGRYSYKLGY